MTIVAGIVDNGVVHMAADTISGDVNNWTTCDRIDPKLFISGRALVGFTTSYRMGQVLMYADLFKGKRTISHKWMVTEFVPAVQTAFADAGIEKTEKGVRECGSFMVAMGDKLFVVYDNYQVAEPEPGYAAIGCGEMIALGALFATKAHNDPVDRLEVVIESAIEHSPYCGGSAVYSNTADMDVHAIF